jgi:hypothetical protein
VRLAGFPIATWFTDHLCVQSRSKYACLPPSSSPTADRAIQNTTFGGIQGFTVPPNTSWFDDSGAFAGTVRQERNWTLGILYGAGHQTPVINPARTYAFIRDFFVGNSTVGLVETDASGAKTIHTASTPASAAIPTMLPDGVLPGQTDIYWKNNEKTTVRCVVSSERAMLKCRAH